MLQINSGPNESTFQVILSISKISVRKRPRARFARAQVLNNVKTPFFRLIRNPDTFLDHFHQFGIISINNKVVWARQSSKSARASMAKITSKRAKTCLYKINSSSLNSPLTPQFFSYLGRGGIIDMISWVI